MSFLWPQTNSSQNSTSDSSASLTNISIISQPLAKRGFNPFCLNAGTLSQQCFSHRTCSMLGFGSLSHLESSSSVLNFHDPAEFQDLPTIWVVCLCISPPQARDYPLGGCVTNLGGRDGWLPVLQVLPKLPGNLVNSKGFVDVSAISRYEISWLRTW